MEEIKVRRYTDGDEIEISKLIEKDLLTENIKDYPEEIIQKMIEEHNSEIVKRRTSKCHAYVLLDNQKIVGVGMIAKHRDNPDTDAIFLTIFIDPEYKGKGLGRKIIEALEQDDYYKESDRVEIPASLTAVEFYKHFGYGFKSMGHIEQDGMYRLEKFPRINQNNVDHSQYNMRRYIDNKYHNYKEFIYQTKKQAYKKYVEECWGIWNEDDQRKYFEDFINMVYKDAWIIQLNGKDIGFYNGTTLEDGSYEIGNICIIPEYQGKGIGTQVLKDIMELHKEQDLYIQYFKQNPVGSLYTRLGFVPNGETEFHYQMIKPKQNSLKK